MDYFRDLLNVRQIGVQMEEGEYEEEIDEEDDSGIMTPLQRGNLKKH